MAGCCNQIRRNGLSAPLAGLSYHGALGEITGTVTIPPPAPPPAVILTAEDVQAAGQSASAPPPGVVLPPGMEEAAPVVVAVAPAPKASSAAGWAIALLALGGVGYLVYGRKGA